MTAAYVEITGLDPIVARDGRPFGDGTGNRMRGLPWPLPSAVAGSARRALVVAQPERCFDETTIQQLLATAVAGVFPVVDGQTLYLPAPKNCVWQWDKKRQVDAIYRALPQPLGEGEGCDLPQPGLQPVMLQNAPEDDFKPEPVPAWWPVDELARWLSGEPFPSGQAKFGTGRFLTAARQQLRDRVCINPWRGAAEESRLFAVSDLNVSCLEPHDSQGDERSQTCYSKKRDRRSSVRITLSLRLHPGDLADNLSLLHPLGGNRRLVCWRTAPEQEALWKVPARLADRLAAARQVCLMLATPALFELGYLPGWLDHTLTGSPPGIAGLRVKLVGIICDRWRALARFSYDWRQPGPRPLRRMVPAGSMYFFQVLEGNPAVLAEAWLQSVCDDPQDRRDGFGLAVWGIW
ncbi:MAG: type III-B CRISPR module-associated protein Cmr3 [Gemmataceae bacterium]|nr:type III-B CRISPR module-associated protein Cmr3 [Gemmataceae bacterium]